MESATYGVGRVGEAVWAALAPARSKGYNPGRMAELAGRRPPESGAVGADGERWALVCRVAGSHGFLHAKQLRDFLLYVAEHALSNDTAEINEYKIGCHVLHRRPDFNPAEDNIVRVQARRLRDKLAEYFASEGRDEPVVIEIPKGSYIPEFRPRPVTVEEPPAPPSAVAAAGRAHPDRWRMVSAALTVAVAVLAVLVFILWRAAPGHPRILARAEPRHPVLSAIFSPENPTTLVASDASLIPLVNNLNQTVTLHAYLDPAYPENALSRIPDERVRGVLLPVANGEYVSLTELNVAAQLFELGRAYGGGIRVRHARQMNIRDFDNGNFVVVGTPVSNPWFDLFDEDLEYAYDPHTRSLRNRNSAQDAGQYSTTDHGTFRESYVAVGLLPNLTGTGWVLILNGLAPRAPEAAANLLFSADFAARATKASGLQIDRGAARHFEMLVRVRMVSGTPKSAEIVMMRGLREPASGGPAH